MGARWAMVIASPYARRGFVSHTTSSHVSLLRFAETLYGLDPLTDRDASASDMLDCFDFGQEPFLNQRFVAEYRLYLNVCSVLEQYRSRCFNGLQPADIIADNAVMPAPVSGNTQATAYVIGAKAAALILAARLAKPDLGVREHAIALLGDAAVADARQRIG